MNAQQKQQAAADDDRMPDAKLVDWLIECLWSLRQQLRALTAQLAKRDAECEELRGMAEFANRRAAALAGNHIVRGAGASEMEVPKLSVAEARRRGRFDKSGK